VGNFLRPLSRTLPAGNATSSTYYANTVVVANPCPAGGSANQAGRLRLTSAPSPDGGSTPAWTTEYIYDAAGRVVATRRNTDPWTCLTYDGRGRMVTEAVPALPAPLSTPARTVTLAYSVTGDPRATTVADSAGTITTRVDLLGRVVSYTDAWGNATTSTYDQPGRLTDTVGRDGTRHTGFDAAGRPLTQSIDSTVLATATYDPTSGDLASVAYNGNGTALASIGRDPAGRTTALNFSQAGGASLVTDAVGRSQSGRVVSETVDGTAASTFTYDAPGRLAAATVPGHSLTYTFTAAGNCGLAPAAGKNTNRTAVIDNGGAPTTYCYNQADQLTSSSDTSVGTPTYDAHGNTKTMGTQTLTYDGSDRHVGTTTGSTTVTYVRDATDRIISRTEGGTTLRYGFDGPGSGSAFTTDSLGLGVQDRTVALVGGVLVTKRSTGDVWSYPNIHGDMVATADPAGAKRGGTLAYDPFGTALSTSGPTDPDSVPDNSGGNFDYGWLGQAQSGLEHAPGIATIEMGARPYVPGTGRFLQVDPVEGGSCNDYDYVCGDPVNGLDVGGRFFNPIRVVVGAGEAVAGAVGEAAVAATHAAANAVRKGSGSKSKNAPQKGQLVYRVYGGLAGKYGTYWTPLDPRTATDYRVQAGLPDENSCTRLVTGRLKDASGIQFGAAQPINGIGGGWPEYIIPNPKVQVDIMADDPIEPPC
jgi:RHS repeat-associated protein